MPGQVKNPGKAKGNTLCFVIGNRRWTSCRRDRNRYCSVISAGFKFRRPDSLNIGSHTSAIN